MTSAPRSARMAEQNGPGTNIEKSATRTPASGSQAGIYPASPAGAARIGIKAQARIFISSFPHVRRIFQIRRRIDDEHARLLRGGEEDVRLVGGKEAGLARLHLELVTGHLDMRFALEQVADLLDAGMRVRQRALAAAELAHQHLDLLRAHRLGSDQAEILRAGVIGG